MERVHTFVERQFDGSSQSIAIVIGESQPDQLHIGILHCADAKAPAVLHLAWHCRLQNDTPFPDYFTVWVAPAFLHERLRQIAALCRRIWKRNAQDGLPYAFSRPDESIDAATGAYLIGPSRFGLTCSSFVLAVFHAAGLQLVAYDTWPSDREGDRAWQESVIGKLEGRAPSEHIDQLRKDIGAVRYRPEEVAAATALAPPPACLDAAVELGEQIVAKIQQAAQG